MVRKDAVDVMRRSQRRKSPAAQGWRGF